MNTYRQTVTARPACRSVARRRTPLAACAAAAVTSLWGAAATRAAAPPEMLLDLRVTTGGGKSATVTTASPTVNLTLYAFVRDPDGDGSNTGFEATQGLWTSSAGGLLGNLSTSLASPYSNGFSSQNPTPADRDGDGDLDVGNVAGATSGFFIAAAGGAGSFGTSSPVENIGGVNYRRFALGTGTFTATSFNALGSTHINFVPRTGDNLVRPHKYLIDSTATLTSVKGDDVRLALGDHVTVSLVGANYTWTRGAGTGDWGSGANWSPNAVPNSTLDTVTFAGAGVGSAVSLNASRTVSALHFTHSSGSYMINNGSTASTLSINNGTGGGTIHHAGAGQVTFGGGGQLTISSGDLNVDTAAGATVNLNTPVLATKLTKLGPGVLALGTSNAGNIANLHVNAGTLRVTTQQSVANSTIHLAAGALLDLRATTGGGAFNRPVVVNGSATISAGPASTGTAQTITMGALSVPNGGAVTVTNTSNFTLAFAGPVSLANNPTTFNFATAAARLNLNGQISGPSAFTVGGAAGSQLFIGGTQANTYANTTVVNAGGTLAMGKPFGVNAIGGNVVVNAGGTLLWQQSEQVPDSATLTLQSGGTINLNGFVESVKEFVDLGGTTLLGSGGQLIITGGDLVLGNGTAISTPVSLARDLIYNGTTNAAVVSGTLSLANHSINHTFNIANGADPEDVIISAAIDGSTNVFKTGAGTLRYDGGSVPNTYTGSTTVAAGTLELAKFSGTVAIAGPLEVAGGTVRLVSGGQIADTAAVTVNGGTLDLNGTSDDIGSLGGTGGTIALPDGSTLNVNQAVARTFAGQITGAGELVKQGAAPLTLTGNNTFAGGVTIRDGSVRVASDASLGAGTSIRLQGGTLATTASFVTAKNLRVPGDAGGSGGVDVAAGTTFSVTGNVTTPAGPITKTGGGTLAITGGGGAIGAAFEIEGGALALSGSRALVTAEPLVINAGGALDLSASTLSHATGALSGGGAVLLGAGTLTVGNESVPAGSTFGGQITGPGGLILDATHPTTLTGASTVSGALTVSRGALALTAGGSFDAAALKVADDTFGPSLAINAAAVTVGAGHIYGNTPAGAVVTLGGAGASLAVANDLYVGGEAAGPAGVGTLSIGAGAAASVGGTLKVYGSGATQVALTGGSLTVGTLDTGGDASRFNWSAGALQLGALDIAAAGPLGGTYTLGANKTLTSAQLNVGDATAAQLTIAAGAAVTTTTSAGIGGAGAGHSGQIVVTGAGSTWTIAPGAAFTIGELGADGSLDVANGGSVVAAGGVGVGRAAGSVSEVNLSAGGRMEIGGDLTLALTALGQQGGTGNVTVNNGVLLVGGQLRAGEDALIRVNDGGWLGARGIEIHGDGDGATAAGILVSSGGTVAVGADGITLDTGPIALLGTPAAPARLLLGGNYTFTGDSAHAPGITIDSLAGADSGVVDLLGGDRTFNIAPPADGVDAAVVIDAKIINGGIIKTGTGKLELAGANDYAGATDVRDGTLIVAAADALPAATAVRVGGDATLALASDQTIASLADSGPAGGTTGGSVLLNGNTLTIDGQADTVFTGTINGSGVGGVLGAIVKQGGGTLEIGSGGAGGGVTGIDSITVNLGTLRLSGDNAGLTGTVNVTGTGPTFGTLALAGDNLGAASLNLAGGHITYEESATVTRAIALDVGGGTFGVAADKTVTLNTVLGGAGGLSKDGPGTLELNAPSTYGGQTFIAAGTLTTAAPHALPADSEVFVAADATLDFRSNDQTLASITGGGSILLGGASMFVGANDATTAFTGPIAGGGALFKSGSGTLTLAGAVEFNAGITIDAGAVELAGTNASAASITVNGGAALIADTAARLGASANAIQLHGGTFRSGGTFDLHNPVTLTGATGGTFDILAGGSVTQHGALTGNGPLSKTGAGTLRVQAPLGPTGNVNVRGGDLVITGAGALPGVGEFTVSTGATLVLDNTTANIADRITGDVKLAGGTLVYRGRADQASTESAGSLVLTAGASEIQLQQAGSGSTELTFAVFDPAPGATFNLLNPGSSSNKLILAGQPVGFLNGRVTVNGTNFAKYTAEGVVALTPQEYEEAFTDNAHVKLSASAATAGRAIRTLTLSASSEEIAVTQSGTLTLADSGLLKAGVHGATISGGAVAAGNGQLNVFTASGGGLTIHSALTGVADLSKSGEGLLELTNNTAAHDFTGGIYLNAGTLRVSFDANLGAGGDNDLSFAGGTLQTTAAITLAAARTLNVGDGGGTLDVTGGALTLGAGGQLDGAGPLVKTGSQALRITAANPFTGHVTVQQGSLELASASALGNVPLISGGKRSQITLAPGGSLDLRADGPDAVEFGNDVVVLDNSPPGAAATITTGGVTPGTDAGAIRLQNLRIGQATLNTGGTSGTLEFRGIATLTGGVSTFATARDLVLADRVTGAGSLHKLGAAKLTLGGGDADTAANTYAGDTVIAGGVLELNKAAGTVAIPGNIALSGGTLVLLQPRQIADNSQLLLSGGTFNVGGQSDAIQSLNNTGAAVVVSDGGSLTVGTTVMNGGSITIGADPNAQPRGGPFTGAAGANGGPTGAAADETITGAYVTDKFTATSGATRVNPGGTLEIRTGGLFFSGETNPTITLVASDTATPTAGRMILRGDVTNQSAASVAHIANSGTAANVGVVELGDAIRTFTVADANGNLLVTSKLSKGGLYKTGSGLLRLHAAGDYTLGTEVALGTLEARDGALGAGPVTLSGGRLNLRSNLAAARFGNDVAVLDNTTINIDRFDAAPTTGKLQLGRLTMNGTRLQVGGARGGTLEFTAPVALTEGVSVIDNAVPVLLGNVISGPGAITKDAGASTLTFGGTTANTYAGATRVNAGTLQLAKPIGVTAVPGTLAVFGSGKVQWSNSDQVSDNAAVTINGAAAQLDLNNKSDTVGPITMTGGLISTGAGTLRLNGNVTTLGGNNVATIAGNLALGDLTRTFTVANGTPETDLSVPANISGAGGIIKAGAGTLELLGNNSFTGGVTVIAGTLKTPGTSQFSGTAALNVSTGTLDLPGNFNTAPGTVINKSGAGTLTVRGPQSHGSGAQLNVQQGAVNLNTDVGAPATRTLAINAAGGTLHLDSTQHAAAFRVAAGAHVTLTPGHDKLLYTNTLTATAGAGRINLNDNAMIVGSGTLGRFDGTSYTDLTGLIVAGYGDTTWNGNGIYTGMPDAQNSVTTIGVVSVQEMFGGPGEFAGQDLPASAIIMAYTYYGDSNLDGAVDGGDYAYIDAYVGSTEPSWLRGDYNLDGFIDGGDYAYIDVYVGRTMPQVNLSAVAAAGAAAAARSGGDGPGAGAVSAGLTAVPEPASLTAGAALLGGWLARRKRSARRSAAGAP